MKNTLPQIVLSSSSSARRALLARLPIPFVSTSPDVDENPLPGEGIHAMVSRLAEMKAKKSAAAFPQALIIGCDTAGMVDDILLSKPETHENAVQQLRLVSGKKAHFLTSLCLLNAANGDIQLAVEVYDVYFRRLSDAMIENYLRREQPYYCAGSFQAEGLGIALIEKFHGDDYTALIGLPLIRLISMLEKAGVNVLA